MKISGIVLMTCIFLSASSCSENKTKLLEDRRAEVMTVHDEAMAKHGILNKYSRILKGVLTSKEDMAEMQEIAAVLKKLQKANTAMMKWMQEYKDPDSSLPYEAKMEYFDKVQKEMETIHLQIEEAITSSEPLVQKYQK